MAADDERAKRIRDLKNALKADDPTKTARWIADRLDVSERSVAVWAATGAIGYPNCVRLAELIFDVDAGWLWRGEKGTTPDLLTTLRKAADPDSSQLDRIQAEISDLHDDVKKLARTVAQQSRELRALRDQGRRNEPPADAQQ